MNTFTKRMHGVKTAAATVLVASSILVMPSGAAHAATADCQTALAQRQPGVYLFSDINFQGDCQYWGDRYGGNNLGDVGNDRASSMKVIPEISGRGYMISLYQNTNLTGAMWTKSADAHADTDIADFRQHTMTLWKNLNDRVSSILITRTGRL